MSGSSDRPNSDNPRGYVHNPDTPFLNAIRHTFVDRTQEGYRIVERILADAFDRLGYTAPLVTMALGGPMLFPLHVVEADEAKRERLAEREAVLARQRRNAMLPQDDYGDGWDWEHDRPIYP